MLKSKRERAEEKIKQLEEKRAKVNAQIQREKVRLSQAERKRDTRRKILVGSIILTQVERGEISRENLMKLLDERLEREQDRELFGLENKQ